MATRCLVAAALILAGWPTGPQGLAARRSQESSGISFDPQQLADTTRRHLPHGRYYYLYLPTGQRQQIPLVIVLHGLHQKPANVASDSRFTTYASEHDLAVAYGVGVAGAWNAGSCCRLDHHDDITYLIQLASAVQGLANIDRSRIYLVGFSNGGMMSLRAACERPDLFAAAGVMSGALVTTCRPRRGVRGRPLYVRQFQGTADRSIPVRGGFNSDLNMEIPPLSSEPSRLPAGSEVAITLLPSLGHRWATLGNSGVDATSQLFSWMARHRLPSTSAVGQQLRS